MKVEWLGHSCFKIEKEGFSAIFDPYADGSVPGLVPMRESANMVFCSHEHRDHNGRENIRMIEGAQSLFSIEIIPTYHDNSCGAQRGENRIFILSDGKTKLVHMGDLGCDLTEKQIEKLKDVDIMMIPVGGYYTIDSTQAVRIVKKTTPRIVIPMHYRSDKEGYGYEVLDTVGVFTEQMDDVITLDGSDLDTDRILGAQAIVLQPKNQYG